MGDPSDAQEPASVVAGWKRRARVVGLVGGRSRVLNATNSSVGPLVISSSNSLPEPPISDYDSAEGAGEMRTDSLARGRVLRDAASAAFEIDQHQPAFVLVSG